LQMAEQISRAIESLDEEKAVELLQAALKEGIDPAVLLNRGLGEGLHAVGDRFARQEYFILELLTAGQLGERLIQMITPYLPPNSTMRPASVVIGSVGGDLHDIGKNLVAISLRMARYQVYDIGVDVHPVTFIRRAQKVNARVIALSSLMLVTMAQQAEVMQYLKEMGLRDQFLVVVGGGVTTQEWAEAIGADGWAPSATETVTLINRLLGEIEWS